MTRRHKLKPIQIIGQVPENLPPGSDVRVRGGVSGRCRLCGTRTRLCLSHIIPKWGYHWHRTSWGGAVRGSYESIGVRVSAQDGNKHYLLCRSCEERASEAEHYVYALTNGSFLERRSRGILALPLNIIFRFRLDRVVTFVCITALRAHYAPSAPFHHVSIPRRLRKLMRDIIFRGYSSDTAAVFDAIHFVRPKTEPTHDPREDIYLSYDATTGAFAMLLGGWEWLASFVPDSELYRVISRRKLRPRKVVRFLTGPYNLHRNMERLYKDGRLITRA